MLLLGGGIPDSLGKLLAGLILPAVQAADAAAQRSQRQHAFLVTVEALRAYAAEHNGQLPKSLDDLRPLPAWSDPTTSKPFSYRRTDPTQAVLITEKSLGVPNEFHIEMVMP
jgi:type II secretory pathway pseudopilin PulG